MKRLGLLVIMFVFLSTNAALAVDYIGKYCLYLTSGDMSEENQLSLTAIDETNFALNGTATNASTAGVGSVVGNAAIVGDSIILTLHKSQTNQQGVSISTVNARLGLPLLEGEFQSITQNYVDSFVPISHVSGVARLAECNSSLKTKCEIKGGSWAEQYSECVGISEGACQVLEGQYESCGSACRHNLTPDTVCTTQCVAYCSF